MASNRSPVQESTPRKNKKAARHTPNRPVKIEA